MSVEQSAKAWKLNIQGSLKLVLLSLADHADSHGRHVFPSQDLISKRCGISVRQVRRLFNQLEALGLIIPVKYPKGGRNHTTEYELTLDQPETVETIEISNKPDVSGVSGIVSRLGGGYFVPEEFINQPLENIKAVNLSAFTEPDIESKTRTNATQKADICDINPDICDIKADIAMSDQPSITVIEPSIEPLDGAKAPKPQPIYPEWFIPLTGLHGFVNREYPKAIPTIEAQCKASGVSVSTVVAAFAEYYADSYITHNWKNPVLALKGTLRIQIKKARAAQQQKTTTPRQVAPAEDIDTVWANTAAFFERD